MELRRADEIIRTGTYGAEESLIRVIVYAILGIVFTIPFIAASVLCTLMAGVGMTYITTGTCMLSPTHCWIAFAGGILVMLVIAILGKLLFEELVRWQFKVASMLGFVIAIIAFLITAITGTDSYWLSHVIGWSIFVSFWYAGIAND